MRLGTSDQIKLLFDDLDVESKNYRFTIVHCDANWQPTTHLLQSEYIKGFFDDNITDYQYSRNTIQRYVHYELLFPTENLKPSKSGNYILKVFLDYDLNDVVLTRRFRVMDERVKIIPDVHRPSIIEDYNYKQEVNFTILTPNYQIQNPYQDLKVILMQNDRNDNAITNLKPLFVKDAELTYNYEKENVFPGGNEFHAFDISSMTWRSEQISIVLYPGRDTSHEINDSIKTYHVYLTTDKQRNYLKYFSEIDKNGRFKINRAESSTGTAVTEAEYVYVKFSLTMSAPMTDGGIYLLGELTDWKYSNESKMIYNYAEKEYQLTLLLKQGYYNYQYTFLKDNEKCGDETLIEGTHYETENEYVIYVYNTPMGSNYDQLIGMKRFNSLKY